MQLAQWILDLLRDSVWNGIVGIITILTVLFTLVRLVINLVRGVKVQQSFINTVNKTIAEVASLIRKVIGYVLTRGWKFQGLVSVLIFLGIWGQHRTTQEIATTFAVLSVICWLLIRAAYITNFEIRKLSEEVGGTKFEYLPLDNVAIADDFTRRYPDLRLGINEFNNIPFLLTTRYFDTSATADRVKQLRLSTPIKGLYAVHILVNAGNAWKRHLDKDLSGTVLGKITLWFTGEATQEVKLILGENVREWAPGNKIGELVDQATDLLSQLAWASKSGGHNLFVIDQLEIPVSTRYRRKALERIVITKDTKPNTPEDILAFSIFAITVEHNR